MNTFFLRFNLFLVLAALSLSSPAYAAGAFGVGSKSVSLTVGSGTAFNNNYTIIGAGFGYYVVDGLELSVSGQAWVGSTPSIKKFSPQIQYVLKNFGDFKPYVGAFFRRSYVDGFKNYDSSGGRAGVFFSKSSGYYLSAGLVYEVDHSCTETALISCSDTYPELSFTLML